MTVMLQVTYMLSPAQIHMNEKTRLTQKVSFFVYKDSI